MKGRSTALQLLCIMDEWTTLLDSGAQVDVIYTDFAKAFATVPHTGPILSVFPALFVHSELKSVHPGFPVAFIF